MHAIVIVTSSAFDKKLEIYKNLENKLEIYKKSRKLTRNLQKISKIDSKFIVILNLKMNSKISTFVTGRWTMVDELNIAILRNYMCEINTN